MQHLTTVPADVMPWPAALLIGCLIGALASVIHYRNQEDDE